MGKILLIAWLAVIGLSFTNAGSNNDLTERLAGDSDAMAGVVGAREAEELVDETLRRYESKQAAAEKSARLAEEESQQSFREYDEARKDAAQNDAEKRHLKTKLAIVLETESNDSKIAERADAIAKKMALLASKAEAQLKHVRDEKQKIQGLYTTVKSKVKSASVMETEAHQNRQKAEAEAQKAAASVAELDLKITKLLDRRSRLKEIAAAEDKKASSRYTPQSFLIDSGLTQFSLHDYLTSRASNLIMAPLRQPGRGIQGGRFASGEVPRVPPARKGRGA